MAKALAGFMPLDRGSSRLAAENNVLRRRVGDLESALVRLQAENDALAALVAAEHLDDEVLEPA